jgi:hypothetical protein
MGIAIKRMMLFAIALVFAAFSLQSAFAYGYDGYYGNGYYGNGYDGNNRGCYGGCGYPIYQAGYWSNTWSYGWSGWNYNRVYYRYHYPYSTFNYYSYPNYRYGGQWNAHYAYNTYPMTVAYPWPGYYW